MESILTINGGGLPPFSAKNCNQELFPVVKPKSYRTVNGELLVSSVMNSCPKYRSLICGEDKVLIALNQSVGAVFEVGCIIRLWQRVEGERIKLLKPFVEGSVFGVDKQGQQKRMDCNPAGEVGVEEDTQFIHYRPKLTMRLNNFHFKMKEWAMQTCWQLELEEV